MLDPGILSYMQRCGSRVLEGALIFMDTSGRSLREPLVIIGSARTHHVGAALNLNCIEVKDLLADLGSRGFRVPAADVIWARTTIHDPTAWQAWASQFGFEPGCIKGAIAARQRLNAKISESSKAYELGPPIR